MDGKKITELLENANVFECLNKRQLFMIMWWTAFNSKKINQLIKSLEDGKSAKFAYLDAKTS